MGFCLFEADISAAVECAIRTCVVGSDGFGLSLGLATDLSVFYALLNHIVAEHFRALHTHIHTCAATLVVKSLYIRN